MPSGSLVLNGQVGLTSSRQMLAGAGKSFVVTNPTPGTAIAFANNTSYSATANGLWCIANNNPSGGASIHVDRLKLIQTATAPANGLVTRAEVVLETGIVTLTGNVATRTPVNLNQAYSNSVQCTVQTFAAGAATVPGAVGTRRIVGVGSLASGVDVRYSSMCFEFGADGPAFGKVGLTAAHATDPQDVVCWMPPVIIAPQSSAWMNLWGLTPDTNVPSYEFCLLFSELA